jgi:hypothetical protein
MILEHHQIGGIDKGIASEPGWLEFDRSRCFSRELSAIPNHER